MKKLLFIFFCLALIPEHIMASEGEPISLESEIFDEGPAYLSGEYLIQFVSGRFCFIGNIVL